VVDLPPEMDEELCLPALKAGINFIRLATPTTDDKRLPLVLSNTSGFVYYVSMTGITGSAIADTSKVNQAVDRIKSHTNLPVCVGFGVKTAEQARAIGQSADGVVVGTAIVNQIANTLDDKARQPPTPSRASPPWCAGLPPAFAPHALRQRSKFATLGYEPEKTHELDHQLRPPENQFDAGPPRGAGKSLDQVSRDRGNGVPQGSGRKPVRDPRLGLPHEDVGRGAAQAHVRRRQVRAAAITEGPQDPLKFRDSKKYSDRLREKPHQDGPRGFHRAAHGKIEGCRDRCLRA
jgi:hypothetical protein